MKPIIILIWIIGSIINVANAQLSGSLKPGPYAVGFQVIDVTSKTGDPIRICIWYPSEAKGPFMKLADYVDIAAINGSQDKLELRNDLKRVLELPFVMGLSSVPQARFDSALSAETRASMNVAIAKGKWPLIISDSEPATLLVTNEYLASHGFITAVPAIQYPPPVNDNSLYSGPTNGLETLLNIMIEKPYVDKEKISALGFGGGSLAAFFLSIRTPLIRSLVNIEGGLFMPQSKTVLSSDYDPSKFKIPLLHIVNPYILRGENEVEWDAVKSPKYRLTLQAGRLHHHDFTIYGRIVNGLLGLRGRDADLATLVYTTLHEYILGFLRELKPDAETIDSGTYYKLDVF